MTKTSTPTNLVSVPSTSPLEKATDETDQQDELFYNSLKPRLNELVMNPSDATIENILAYSKLH